MSTAVVPGQRGRVDVGAVVDEVLLQGHRAHAVPKDRHRKCRVFSPRSGDHQPEVADQCLPAAHPEIAVCRRVTCRATVPAVVGCVSHIAGIDECSTEALVARRVLAHAVGDDDDRFRIGPADHLSVTISVPSPERRVKVVMSTSVVLQSAPRVMAAMSKAASRSASVGSPALEVAQRHNTVADRTPVGQRIPWRPWQQPRSRSAARGG